MIRLLSVQFPLLRADGQPYALCGISTDITELRQAEAERDRLWNYAPDPMCIVGFDGRMIQMNPAWTRSLGWTERELSGMALPELIHPDDRAKTEGLAQPVLSGESITGFENRYRCRDGSYRWFSCSIIPLMDAQVICGLARDITEERLLAEQFHQAQKMEAVGTLAGGIAHDFNNLLTVINGYSEMLLRNSLADDPRREKLSDIREAGRRAAALTSQLLAFRRKAIIAPRLLDLNQVIESTLHMLRRIIPADVAISVLADSELPAVRADLGQLEQVVMNLAINARDAMPQGGQLTFETSRLTLGPLDSAAHCGLKPGPYVRLRVSDTGTGMTREVTGKVFDPFFTTKPVGQGTGLGLAVVHGVIQQCGGHVVVESAVDQGTTFAILLPAAEGTPDKYSAAEISVEPRGQETILLVEDDDAVRKIVREGLEQCGYTVLATNHGREAIGLVENYPYPIDLLLSDVTMPEMRARDLIVTVRAHQPAIKVVLMSGHADDILMRPSEFIGCDAFLPKPFAISELSSTVRAALDGVADAPRTLPQT